MPKPKYSVSRSKKSPLNDSESSDRAQTENRINQMKNHNYSNSPKLPSECFGNNMMTRSSEFEYEQEVEKYSN